MATQLRLPPAPARRNGPEDDARQAVTPLERCRAPDGAVEAPASWRPLYVFLAGDEPRCSSAEAIGANGRKPPH